VIIIEHTVEGFDPFWVDIAVEYDPVGTAILNKLSRAGGQNTLAKFACIVVHITK
jgi:hypothetical protein